MSDDNRFAKDGKLVLDLAPKVLRKYFKHRWEEKYTQSTLWNDDGHSDGMRSSTARFMKTLVNANDDPFTLSAKNGKAFCPRLAQSVWMCLQAQEKPSQMHVDVLFYRSGCSWRETVYL